MSTTQHERNYLKTLARGLRVFTVFTPERPEASLKDISEILDVDPSTASRFAYTLETLGYLERDAESKLYRVSSKTYALTVSLSGPRNLRKVSLPFMEDLRDTTGETAVLGVRDATEMVIIEVVETQHALAPRGWVGGRVPVYCSALGKAMLAHLPNKIVSRLLDVIAYNPYTSHTITNRMDFLADLEKTQTRGWSLNQEEFTRGITSIGAPIFSGDHGVSGAICVDIPTIRIENERFLEQVAQKVVHAAQAISDIGSHNHLE
ncbi:MAG: IclR family transcriptional regulator [Chloroflexi bacterium]|nr:IclR family transcriptional regulator [Chloroflexota bacterium]